MKIIVSCSPEGVCILNGVTSCSSILLFVRIIKGKASGWLGRKDLMFKTERKKPNMAADSLSVYVTGRGALFM